jgi:phosphoenolpyruvate synthase/pyruvate phosphate dikinase
MKAQYREIASLDGRAKERAERAFLAKVRKWIETTEPGIEFRATVTEALRENFGPDGTYGVFVRSDTNVEDLAGFTGAGLNLTVPNVVGEAAILSAVQKVWASPFTDRSYEWRQSHMDKPEYVFPSVVIQKAFPSEKSGVMVTSDVEGGGDRYLTIAVNEGVGGAVDGQSAESLRVDRRSGDVRLLAQAGAKTRRELAPRGGLREVPTSGTDRILQQGEVRELIRLAEEVEDFPALRNDSGEVAPADIEFAFRNGELALLQIRPFNESASARRSGFLSGLDGKRGERSTGRVPLSDPPGRGR